MALTELSTVFTDMESFPTLAAESTVEQLERSTTLKAAARTPTKLLMRRFFFTDFPRSLLSWSHNRIEHFNRPWQN